MEMIALFAWEKVGNWHGTRPVLHQIKFWQLNFAFFVLHVHFCNTSHQAKIQGGNPDGRCGSLDAERNAEREEPVRGEIVIFPPNGRSRREPPLHGKWYGECPWSIFVEVSHIAFLTE